MTTHRVDVYVNITMAPENTHVNMAINVPDNWDDEEYIDMLLETVLKLDFEWDFI